MGGGAVAGQAPATGEPATGEPATGEPAASRFLEAHAGRIAWTILGISLVPLVAGVVLQLGPGANGPPTSYGGGAGATVASAFVILTTCVSGAVIVAAHPLNRLGWLMVSTAPVGSTLALAYGYVAAAPTGSDGVRFASAFLDVIVQPYLLAVCALVLMWFPTGRVPTRAWWPVYVLIGAGAMMRAVEGLVMPSQAGVYPTVRPDPELGAISSFVAWSLSIGGLGFRILQTALLAGAAALVYRYRRADLTERRQIKWVVAAGLLAFVCTLPLGVITVTQGTAVMTYGWVIVLFFLGFSLVGPAILVAISRYRLYEIDRIVNRAVMYGLLTAIITGTATAAVALSQRVFVAATGQSSDVAVVLAILVAASAYAPVRKRLEAFVDRRLKYDRARFGAYRDALVNTIELTRADAAAARLAREVRRELHAHGAAVADAGGEILGIAGVWPCQVVARIDARSGGWSVLVGPRDDVQPYPEGILADVADVVELVERAVTPRQATA